MTLSTPARRTVLGAAAASGAAVLLGACGDRDDTASGSTSPATSSAPAEPSTPAPTTSSQAPAETQPPAAEPPAAEALTTTADVPVGGGRILQGEQLVVTQPVAGQFKCFTAVCTHQNCLVSSVRDNVIACSCHGSQFSAEDGSVEVGPATQPLDEVAVAVQGDSVVRA